MTIISVDIGQAQDYTAIAVIRCAERRQECIGLERLPLGTSYSDVIRRILQWFTYIDGNSIIVIDETGVGRPIVEMARRTIKARIIGITITSGHVMHGWKVPKAHIISALQLAFQAATLKIAAGLTLIDAVREELRNYRVKITKSANEIYEPWRSTQHDDLVLALALGTYAASKLVPRSINKL